MTDVWKRELRTRGAYSQRPRNVLSPLVFGLGAWVRRYDVQTFGRREAGVTIRLRRWPLGDGTEHLSAELAFPGGEHLLRTYQAGASVPVLSEAPKRMRACLDGAGYRMDTRWERALARWAYRRGLRHDRVFGPDWDKRRDMKLEGLWLGTGR